MSDPSAVKRWKLTAVVVAILVGLCSAFAAWPPFALGQEIVFPRCEAPLRNMVSPKLWKALLDREKQEYTWARELKGYQPIQWTCVSVGPKERIAGMYATVFEGGTYFEEVKPGVPYIDQRRFGQGESPQPSPLVGIPDLTTLDRAVDPEHYAYKEGSHQVYIVFDGWISNARWNPRLSWPADEKVILVDRLISIKRPRDVDCWKRLECF